MTWARVNGKLVLRVGLADIQVGDPIARNMYLDEIERLKIDYYTCAGCECDFPRSIMEFVGEGFRCPICANDYKNEELKYIDEI